MPVPLTSVSHLVMLWDKLAMHPGFQIQDPSGRPLGETSGGILGLSNELTVFDTDRRVVLGLTVAIEHRLPFGFLIHDATGAVLATLRPKTSFGSQKFGISIDAAEAMLLIIKSSWLHYEIEDAGTGRVLATADRKMAVRISRTEIDISESQELDHRIVIGSMIMASYVTLHAR